MKRKLITLILLSFLGLSLCITAKAADYISDSDGTYTVEIPGKTAGKDYTIVVVAGDYSGKDAPEPNEENIIYMDQVTADENGKISFKAFIPMTDSVGTIYIGGDDTPLNMGVLMTESGFGYVAGRIISYSGSDTVVTIPEQFDEIAEGAFANSSKIEKIIIKNGSAKLYANAFNKGVKLFLSPVAKGAMEYAVKNGYSYAVLGDYDGDGEVNGTDLTYSLLGYASNIESETTDYSIVFDLDFNGSVNMRDASILLKYLGGKIADFYQAYTAAEINN